MVHPAERLKRHCNTNCSLGVFQKRTGPSCRRSGRRVIQEYDTNFALFHFYPVAEARSTNYFSVEAAPTLPNQVGLL